MQRAEVRDLVALRAEPDDVRVGQHGIQHHQPLDGTRKCDWTTQATVRLADRAIDRLVLEVVQVRAFTGARAGRREAPLHQHGEEVADNLSPDKPGIGGVLARQADAGMHRHGDQKACLARRESELGDGVDAFGVSHDRMSSATRGSNGRPRPRPLRPPIRAPPERYCWKPERPLAAAWAPR